ncbi:MAG: DNA polymerase III subunit delta [Bacteroidales bacterium]
MAKLKLIDTVAEFERIKLSLHQKIYKPFYLLYGKDAYYIDQLSDFFANNILSDSERTLNQTILYGKDVTVQGIIEIARRYPMMATHQVVIVKEAQDVKKIELLMHYLDASLSSTILVICYKGTLGAKAIKLSTAARKIGEVLETSEVRDYELPNWITSQVKQKNKKIDIAAVNILRDFLGADLAKIAQAVNKLLLLLPVNLNTITANHVESCIGVSKDFNPYELTNAILIKDVFKANQIILYFEKNPKVISLTGITSTLFMTFSRLFTAHMLLTNKKSILSDIEIREHLGLVSFVYKQTYLPALSAYSATKCANVISLLREFDMRAKGCDNVSSTHGDLLRELVYKLIH